MSLCIWKRSGDKNECIVCGRKVPGKLPLTMKRKCTPHDSHKTLIQLIDTCPHRGEDTGREVTCGCASMPKQPVFICDKHTEAIRYKSSRTEFDGIACIECDYPREELKRRKNA